MKGPSVAPTVEAGNGSWRFAPRRFPGQSAAAPVALNTGPATSGVDQAPVTDAQVQKALIDVRAGERASRGAGVPSAEFWADFRAAERQLR